VEIATAVATAGAAEGERVGGGHGVSVAPESAVSSLPQAE
jgi:hypothetical protein